uniref:Uncharacterized protein n=1 Tax=Candidatus Kentrum sp. TUN TaxID=2126343 RepID=A0A451AFG1_9GAMM|nr:MAG: hypothetical protein BECKTUN1418F_GA0071002_12674 [Candidatus Kentron sp. TUN]VFK64758.1 MAG: hypothetical protein BECKTUN1418D_GA0071000_12854 [Candidatus Kentron sp. TUN]VFK70470.1 MAG: hypothetical protein BECKTUN1418E_GA0071001_12684 [Candidatus Kentron sp. TUN]
MSYGKGRNFLEAANRKEHTGIGHNRSDSLLFFLTSWPWIPASLFGMTGGFERAPFFYLFLRAIHISITGFISSDSIYSLPRLASSLFR